ncbi:MAG: beta-galactosidase [Lachnospiraceae bacterium]
MNIYSNKVKKIVYGGDYNPEQWPEEVWEEDIRLFKEAHIDIVTLNVFNWAALQPDEHTYCFDKLDRVMELVQKNGLKVCLATSTGAHPAWMARKYPDILRTEFNGMRRKFGGRHNSCPNSPSYRRFVPELVKRIAQRYRSYDNLVLWHVSNEFGGECYCENCEKAFRVWLRDKYGTLDNLNRSWNTAFWGHTFYDWEDIVLPNLLSEHFEYEKTQFQGITLDYRRFNSESILACYQMESDILKGITPDIPVTTNLMGFYPLLDYYKWGKAMDVIAWDNYPEIGEEAASIALTHDLMRGVGGGKPFLLMEQTPSVTNWLPYNAPKRPGEMRLQSYQAVAHGADSVMFFQMRRSIGACEKLHGAVIDHVGTGNTRIFREIRQLGEELEALGGQTLGARVPARAAIYFDWDNWWGIRYSAGPSQDLDYRQEVLNYYEALYSQNIPVDIIGADDELTGYDLVIAPVLYMTKTGCDEKIRKFVNDGGTFVTTFFSGIVDERDLVIPGGYPGRLRDILGIWVEESDALPSDQENHFTYGGKTYPVRILCDILHTEGAEEKGTYEDDFYKGTPAVTVHEYGGGKAWYAAASSNREFYRQFMQDICRACGITPLLTPQENLEVMLRENENGSFLFLLNHGSEPLDVTMEQAGRIFPEGKEVAAGENLHLEGKDVKILATVLKQSGIK